MPSFLLALVGGLCVGNLQILERSLASCPGRLLAKVPAFYDLTEWRGDRPCSHLRYLRPRCMLISCDQVVHIFTLNRLHCRPYLFVAGVLSVVSCATCRDRLIAAWWLALSCSGVCDRRVSFRWNGSKQYEPCLLNPSFCIGKKIYRRNLYYLFWN